MSLMYKTIIIIYWTQVFDYLPNHQWRRKVRNVGEAENASQSLSPPVHQPPVWSLSPIVRKQNLKNHWKMWAPQSPSPSVAQSPSPSLPQVPQSGPSAPSSESRILRYIEKCESLSPPVPQPLSPSVPQLKILVIVKLVRLKPHEPQCLRRPC